MMRRQQIIGPLVFGLAMNGLIAQARAASADASFEVKDFKALIDDRQPAVVENPASLQYETPALKISATLRCAVPVGKKFTVGFIQQVDSQNVRADYERAFTSFELPSVPMSDADGTDAPWDGNTHERATVTGKSTPQDVELSTDDNLKGHITWHEPLPPDGSKKGPAAELQRVRRDQRFTTWLVARDDDTNRITVLKKVSWKSRVDISVNPGLPLGSRATVKFVPVEQPIVVTPASSPALLSVPVRCLAAPFGNLSQQFWWTPKTSGIGTRTRLR